MPLHTLGCRLIPCLIGIALSGCSTLQLDQFDEARLATGQPVLWEDPGRIRSRDLRFGPGSAAAQPRPPFRFVRTEPGGATPKFWVQDARRTEWLVKLGPEAQSETVSTRLVWSVGYFAEEAYYLPAARIRGLPDEWKHREFVEAGGTVLGARFEPLRPDTERLGNWKWDDNPFVGTREFDGLKVLMILLNNWDARDENNHVIQTVRRGSRELRYVVTDLGATLGRTGGKGRHSKNDVDDFWLSRFVLGTAGGLVEFDYRTAPTGLAALSIVYPPYFLREASREQTMQGIRVEHARWIGGLLSELSERQLRQAFDSGGYDRSVSRRYLLALRHRVAQLTDLPS